MAFLLFLNKENYWNGTEAAEKLRYHKIWEGGAAF